MSDHKVSNHPAYYVYANVLGLLMRNPSFRIRAVRHAHIIHTRSL